MIESKRPNDQHWRRPTLNPHPADAGPATDRVPLPLSSILLVEANPSLRASRRLLFASLEHPVLAVGAYADVRDLPPDSNCCLVAIDITHNEHEAARIARHVRRTWPDTKILLLGTPSLDFGDPLYDDAVSSGHEGSGVLMRADALIRSQPCGSDVAAVDRSPGKTTSLRHGMVGAESPMQDQKAGV